MSFFCDGIHRRYAVGVSRDRPRCIVAMPLSPKAIFIPTGGFVAMARQPNGIMCIMDGSLPVSSWKLDIPSTRQESESDGPLHLFRISSACKIAQPHVHRGAPAAVISDLATARVVPIARSAMPFDCFTWAGEVRCVMLCCCKRSAKAVEQISGALSVYMH